MTQTQTILLLMLMVKQKKIKYHPIYSRQSYIDSSISFISNTSTATITAATTATASSTSHYDIVIDVDNNDDDDDDSIRNIYILLVFVHLHWSCIQYASQQLDLFSLLSRYSLLVSILQIYLQSEFEIPYMEDFDRLILYFSCVNAIFGACLSTQFL